jgi:uncharacterized protein (TIGR03663 family)
VKQTRASREKQRRNREKASVPGSSWKPSPAAGGIHRITVFQGAAAAMLVATAVLRLLDLTVKPLHHDEGVNGLFLTTLFRNGYYRYDPANYHGPTLYYFGWITTTINSFFYGKDGLSTFAIRLVTALFGIGVVWLLLCLRRQLGTFAAVSAAALAAVSPGLVFFSRYFIHEILFVFFTLGVVVAILRFRESRRPRDLILAALSAALMGATKETWIITLAVWLIAFPCTTFYLRLRNGTTAAPTTTIVKELLDDRNSEPAAENGTGAPWTKTRLYGTAAAVFVVVWVMFYSSFFTNFPHGIYDSVLTYSYWFKTGTSSPHDWGPWKYLEWLKQQELPVMILGTMGIAAALASARSRFAVFTAFWSLGILAAYSLVHYKTPWCALNIILPFAIMAGYGLEQLYRITDVPLIHVPGRWLAALAAATAVGFSSVQAVDLSFQKYDDDTQAYVYAHTRRDFLSLVNEIDDIAAGSPAGNNIGIVVMSPEHWPLPWYLRNYPRTLYSGKVIETSEPIIVVHESQLAEVEQLLGNRYQRYSRHELRPGNILYLYVKKGN